MQTWAYIGKGSVIAGMVLVVAAGVAGLLSLKNRPARLSWMNRLYGAAWFFVSFAMFQLIGLFLTDAFAFVYVAERSHRGMAIIYKISALWAGQEGSLLLWLWMQVGFGVMVARRAAKSGRRLDRGAAATMALISGFFALLSAFVADPFVVRLPGPMDGAGLNPILQSYWMATHPIMLYLGFVGLSVPFAYAVSALWTRESDWIKVTRRWTLTAWTFLSVGILYGARWAYEQLGWGGYWGWDPVENASLMPWLVATALIHSGIIEEKRGMLKRWNVVLVYVTYGLTLFGTFLTRSGVLSSVHAFVESDISPWFIGFIGVVTFAFLYLLIARWDDLKDDHPIVSPMSKESSFLAQNVVFLATMFAIFWGTVFPIVASFLGRQVTVGTPYFNRVTGPLFWVMIMLMGIGPVISWRRASLKRLKEGFTAPLLNALFMLVWLLVVGLRDVAILLSVPAVIFVLTTIIMEFVKGVRVRRRGRGEPWWLAMWRLMNRSPGRYGGYVVHFGVLLLVLGIAFSTVYQQERNVVLVPGEEAHIGPFSVTLFGIDDVMHREVPAVEAVLLVRDQRGEALGYLNPAKRFYFGAADTMGPTTQDAILGTWHGDLYAVLAGWEPFGTMVGFKLFYNPLVWLLWAGGGVLVFGGFFSLWPRRQTLTADESAATAMVEVRDDFEMGKVDEAEYEAMVGELSPRAVTYVTREQKAMLDVLNEVSAEGHTGATSGRPPASPTASSGKASKAGSKGSNKQRGEKGFTSLIVWGLAILLSGGVLFGAAGWEKAYALDDIPFGMMDVGFDLVVPSQTIIVTWNRGVLSVFDHKVVRHVGEEPVSEIALPVPPGAVLRSVDVDTVEITDDGLFDRLPMAAGETRRYVLQYDVPVDKWPFGFTTDVVYPTGELLLLTRPDELTPMGIDLIPIGSQTVADVVFDGRISEWVAPGTTWHVALRPGPNAPMPGHGWQAAVVNLPVLAELDRFPGDWLLQRAVRRPGVTAVVVVTMPALVWWMRRRAVAVDAARSSDPEMTLLRQVARLDLAYEAGNLSRWRYGRQRRMLMARLSHGMTAATKARLQKQLTGGKREGGPHGP